MNIKALVMSILLLTFSSVNLTHAASYQFCKKWVVDAIAVTCKSNEQAAKTTGSLIFFKQLAQNSWGYHATNARFPFDITLQGPGLEGPHVTPEGKIACDLFCQRI